MADLSKMSPRTRFSARSEDYAKYRPTYPQAALAWILDGLPPVLRLRIADIGAGTGISSRLLAQRGAQVVAVDPNPQMIAAAGRHTRVRYVPAPAEATGLPGHSFDLITCFQSFHWFARDEAMMEFKRLLKPYGRITAIWNNRDRNEAFMADYSALIESFGEEVALVDRGIKISPVPQTLAAYGFTNIEDRTFAHFHRMDLDSFIGYARSASYLPREGPDYERLREGLEQLYRRYADDEGFVVFPYRTMVYRADLPHRGAAP